ncbi:MAG: hypothetical protein V1809_13445 [Planctomycetota bacterium]
MRKELGIVNDCSSPAEKIALFRSLFRGRDDVYVLDAILRALTRQREKMR